MANRLLQYDFDENSATQVNEGTLGTSYNATGYANRYEVMPSGAGGWHQTVNSDKLTAPDGSGIDNLESFSFEIIYKPHNLTSEARLFDKSGTSTEGFRAWVASDGRIHIRRYNNPGFMQDSGQWRGFYTTNSVISANNWYHIQISWDGNDTDNHPVIYINSGSAQALTEDSHSSGIFGFGGWWDDGGQDLVIGNRQTTGASYWIDGKIVYVALWNDHLTEGQFDTEYTNEYWRAHNINVAMPKRDAVASAKSITPQMVWDRTVSMPKRSATAAHQTVTPLRTQNRSPSMPVRNVDTGTGGVYVSFHYDKTKTLTVTPTSVASPKPVLTFTQSRTLTTTSIDSDLASPGAYKPFYIIGTLTRTTGGAAVKGREIVVTRVDENGNYLEDGGSSITNNSGEYSVRLFESLPGQKYYKADWVGDDPGSDDPDDPYDPYAPSFATLPLYIQPTTPVNYSIIADSVDDYIYYWGNDDDDFRRYSLELTIVTANTSGVYIQPVTSETVDTISVDEKTQYRFAVECKADITPTVKITCYDASDNTTQVIAQSYPECADDPDTVKLCTLPFWTPPTTTKLKILFGCTDVGIFRADNFRLNEIITKDTLVVPCDTIEMSTASLVPRFSHIYEKDPQYNFYKFIDAFGQEFDILRRIKEEVRRGFHIRTAMENDLDQIGALINTPRVGGETDGHYRARLMATGAGAMEGVTIASIKRVCELYTGIEPNVAELWMTGDPNCPWAPYCPTGPAIVVGFRNYKQMKLNWDDTFDLILKIRDAGVVVYTGPITEFYDFVRPTDSLVVTDAAFECAIVDDDVTYNTVNNKINMSEVC